MVIVQIASASTGGIGRLTRDVSDVLNKKGIRNYIAYGRGEVYNPERDYMFGSKAEILMHGFLTRVTDKTGVYSKRGTRQLLDFLDCIKPDIIQLHNLHGYYLNYEMLFEYIKKHNIVTVWTLHDCWAYTGHCTYYTYECCEQWKSHCFKCTQLRKYPTCWFKGNVESNFERKKNSFTGVEDLTLVTPSKWLAGQTKDSFLKEYRTRVIHNGIDLKLFRVKEEYDVSKYHIPNKKIVLGLASTWGARKGEDDFIQLAAILPPEYIVVMVGLPNKKIKKLPDNVIGIEHTENVEELVDIYNAADIFLNLTYEDNFPTTNLEAMACGTSVLTYQTGGSPESITKESGYVVQAGDIQKVKDIIVGHKKNQQTISACRENSLRFNKNDRFNEYVDLYVQLKMARNLHEKSFIFN